MEIEAADFFFVAFVLINLGIFMFRRRLAPIVFALFESECCGRFRATSSKPTRFLGMSWVPIDRSLYQPSKEDVISILAWTGLVNFIGCVGLFALVLSGFFESQR